MVPAQLLPQLILTWLLSNAEGGWLAGMVFAGYTLAGLPLISLTGRISAHRTAVYRAHSARYATWASP
jgi:fucose permease